MAPLWRCLFRLTAGLCDVYVYEENKNLNAPPWAPVRLDAPVRVSNIL